MIRRIIVIMKGFGKEIFEVVEGAVVVVHPGVEALLNPQDLIMEDTKS